MNETSQLIIGIALGAIIAILIMQYFKNASNGNIVEVKRTHDGWSILEKKI